VTPEAKECIRTLLHPDPAKRPSAKEALEIPFIRGNQSERLSSAPLVHAYKSFKRFSLKVHFKAVARACVARAAQQVRHPLFHLKIRHCLFELEVDAPVTALS
jgi:siderophore synthetase component